jgi:hypothetical protein
MTPPDILITGKRLQLTAKALCIPYTESVRWEKRYGSRFSKRIVEGILIAPENEATFRAAIQKRNATRLTPSQKADQKQKRQQNQTATFTQSILKLFPSMPPREARICSEHTTEIGSRRVGRSTIAENPVTAAVIAHIRHHHTDYDSLLTQGYSREDARTEVQPLIQEILQSYREIPCQTPSLSSS